MPWINCIFLYVMLLIIEIDLYMSVFILFNYYLHHAIMVGIMALTATSSYYDMTEIATRILPNIVVLSIDPDR